MARSFVHSRPPAGSFVPSRPASDRFVCSFCSRSWHPAGRFIRSFGPGLRLVRLFVRSFVPVLAPPGPAGSCVRSRPPRSVRSFVHSRPGVRPVGPFVRSGVSILTSDLFICSFSSPGTPGPRPLTESCMNNNGQFDDLALGPRLHLSLNPIP